MLKSILLTSVCLVLPGAAVAQTVETIIDSATRIPTPAVQVASSVTVIDGAQIEARQQRSLPDVLRDVPGLSVVQTGGPGGLTSVFIRGSNSNHTKILVDGIDIGDPANPNGSPDPGKLLTGAIARVEVLRGPQSGLYGSDAVGGVIAITTKAGEGPLALSGTLEGGSFDSFNQSATIGGAQNGIHFAATIDHLHAGATPVTPLELLRPGEKRNDDYFDSISVSTKLGWDVSGHFDLGLVARYSDGLSRITGDSFDLATFTSYPSPSQIRINTQQYQSRGTAHLVTGWIDQTVGLSYSSTVTSDFDPNYGSLPGSGSRLKLDWQGRADLAVGQTLVLGAETMRDAMRLPIRAGISTNAGYAELQSSWGEIFNSASLRVDDNSRFGSHVTWRLAPAWVLGDTKLKASIGSGFKAPSLEQLFQSFPAFGFFANPNLKPETSVGYDAGVEQSFGNVSAGATYFRNDIKNLITNNASFSMDINVGKALTQGLEAFAAWKASDDLTLR